MGNALLDFVMGLVRDAHAAARFAADPVGSLAAAGLPDVTPADVRNLIPVVADSIAMSTPRFPEFDTRLDSAFPSAADAGNVWTTGAATEAFSAFDHHPIVDAGPADPVPDPLTSQDASALPEQHAEPDWVDSPWPLDESHVWGEAHAPHHDADPGPSDFDLS